jgi:dihydroflavonol-4-reductase
MKALVTGASGFVGSHLVRHLVAKDVSVRAFVRRTSDLSILDGTPIEIAYGDLADADSVTAALKDIDVVFHTAARVSFTQIGRRKLFRTNVLGTRLIVDACLDAGIKRLVHTSSVSSIGYLGDKVLSNEKTLYDAKTLGSGYGESKYLSELEIERGVAEGLDAVIVNPSIIFGTKDPRTEGSRRLVRMFRGTYPYYPVGGAGVVGIDDVCEAHWRAFEKGKAGERYVINSENISYKEIFETVLSFAGKKINAEPLNNMVRILGGVAAELLSFVSRKPPLATVEGFFLSSKFLYYDNAKSRSQLGLSYEPFRSVVEKVLRFHKLI